MAKAKLCPGGFEKCSMFHGEPGHLKCAYARCIHWSGLPMGYRSNGTPFYPEQAQPPAPPVANKCPTCGRGYRKKKKASNSGPTPLEAYIDEQKKKEEGRPYDDDLPW